MQTYEEEENPWMAAAAQVSSKHDYVHLEEALSVTNIKPLPAVAAVKNRTSSSVTSDSDDEFFDASGTSPVQDTDVFKLIP